VLGRIKYVQAVQQQEREERMNKRSRTMESAATKTGIVLVSTLFAGLDEEYDDEENETGEAVSEAVEMVYLTLSWWLRHVGWKDIGGRVRRGVEEVFDEYVSRVKSSYWPLTSKLFQRIIEDQSRSF
jgi:peroxin-3